VEEDGNDEAAGGCKYISDEGFEVFSLSFEVVGLSASLSILPLLRL
jgi:hypothetical protein